MRFLRIAACAAVLSASAVFGVADIAPGTPREPVLAKRGRPTRIRAASSHARIRAWSGSTLRTARDDRPPQEPIVDPLRVIFAGTPEFARVALERLLAARFDIPLVLTQPDRPAGRGMKLQPS